ncbi:nitroreductase family protein [Kribbella sandramycini]|uniref:Nitroreductase n=1 Tax=Kribbella sandramycini TaxID=60450 RepID=A0A7Y4L2I3_9ACTN|nr:nitroreductase family protein [Kribbella sandramycini]MBB6566201.1 nitroreductase [Kribbella sandramycini]NOL43132.1 nitroreductase family protein [Kribbella sandramycini]
MTLTPDELLTTTRTVRKRLDLQRPVPLELVRECIEVAVQAPSGSNRQTWHWMVITDAEKRAAIGEYYRRAVEQYLAGPGAAGKLHADDPDRAPVQRRVGDSVAYLGERMGQVPVLVIPCLQVSKLPAGNQSGTWGSILPAAWSYCLAARSRGLGTAWTTLHMLYEQEIQELLGLPEEIRQSVLLPTAYYTGDTFKPAARQSLDDVIHVDTF